MSKLLKNINSLIVRRIKKISLIREPAHTLIYHHFINVSVFTSPWGK